MRHTDLKDPKQNASGAAFFLRNFLKIFVYELQQRLLQSHYMREINNTCRSQAPNVGKEQPPWLSGEALT